MSQKNIKRTVHRPKEKVKGYVGTAEVDVTGHAYPDLEIYKNKNIPQGKRLLTAIYTDEDHEVYGSSIARTTLYYGSKAFVHCPTIYLYKKDAQDVKLTANLFANNRKVNKGKGKFKLNKKTISKKKLPIRDGTVSETHRLNLKKNALYGLAYEGYIPTSMIQDNLIYDTDIISEAQATGDIILIENPSGTPIVVTVTNIMTHVGIRTYMIARVYHQEQTYQGIIPGQFPEVGIIKFYIDDTYIGQSNITTSGYAKIPYTPTKKGVYTITATYVPTDYATGRYESMSGAGTLYVGDDTNQPVLTELVENCGDRDTDVTLPFRSDRELCGHMQLYLDDELVKLSNASGPDYKLPVSGTSFEFKFHINDGANPYDPNFTAWSFNGNHNMIIKYTTCSEADEEPMVYYYYWEDFYIFIKTEVWIDETEYLTPVKLLYHKEDGTIGEMSEPDAPVELRRAARSNYMIVSDDIPFKVIDVDSPYDPVTQGRVNVRVRSLPNE